MRALAALAVAAGRRAWRLLDPDALDDTAQYVSTLLPVLESAQQNAAAAGAAYVEAALDEQNIDADPAGEVNSSALVGVAADGRSLTSLLLEPVIRVKQAIGEGRTVPQAMRLGRSRLDTITQTEVADAARVATGIGVAATPRVGYVRMLTLPSCARCVILAGRFYRYSDGFQRHPNCDCIHIPSTEDVGGDLRTDPRAAFKGGQIKGLSSAEREAIGDGADINQVVNARRGMYTAGHLRLTRAGTTRHGVAGRRLQGAARLMPEQIYREARSRDDVVRLLRLHGYII
ncbi:hypothetical protein B1813_18965 [Saccharomonospora piscinae]|uniref:Uncharacterized protein n=1 Tax=Saccharomonospora piscinae TaxID=687388 RepID=A0A1V8ZYG9_SACPI|nr:hypothetical protein [Saccharomonospora piscinae]OQO89922.1 hypothetical protein B1813_18965 [Saccharomonospora piscinae]